MPEQEILQRHKFSEDNDGSGGGDMRVIQDETQSLLLSVRRDNHKSTTKHRQSVLIQKIIQTVTYYFVFACFGIAVSLMGPTLKDLARTSHSSEAELGWLFTCKGIGGVLGGLVGGKMFDWFSARSFRATNYFLAFHVFMMGGMMALMPLIPNLFLLMVVFAVFGAAVGFVTMGTNILCMWTWGDKVAPIILGMSCIAGVGNFVGPAIVATEMDVKFVYWIGAMISALSGIMLILGQTGTFCIKEESDVEKKSDDAEALLTNNSDDLADKSEGEESVPVETKFQLSNDWRLNCRILYEQSRDFRLAIAVGFALFGSVIFESCFGGLLYSYVAEKRLATTKRENSMMTSMFWMSLTIGRLCASLLSSLKIKPFLILTSNVVLCYTSVGIFLLISNIVLPHRSILWLAIVLMGLGVSSQFPTTFSFPTTSMNNIRVTGFMSSVMVLMSASAEMTVPVLVTHVFGLANLFWVLLFGCILLTLGYGILFLWALSIQIGISPNSDTKL